MKNHLAVFLKKRRPTASARLRRHHHYLYLSPLCLCPSHSQRCSLLLLLFMISLLLLLLLLVAISSSFLRPSGPGHIAQRLELNSTANRIYSSSLGYTDADAGADTDAAAAADPYHNWQLFTADFEDMMRNFKIYAYPPPSNSNSFAAIFLPHPNPFHPKLGNYFSEHIFKVALLGSSLVTPTPQQAHLFFMPFSVNLLRSDPRVHSEASISEFVSRYTTGISRDLPFWNASAGADHFYVCCHSVCREASSKHPDLHNNAIQVTCSSSYFQRYYVNHKDVGLPQVWPRPPQPQHTLNPPHARLVYFAGRIQNSHIRQQLIALWGNDTLMDILSHNNIPSLSYEQGFRRSRYCLHVRGYEVNTARLSDAIHYGCIPVVISNYYQLPFANVLDWSKFSVIINQGEVALLKTRLSSITTHMYFNMFHNLCQVRRHFVWHNTPRGYDSFYMTAYQLWLRRNIHHLSY
nr:probable glycosyltransferase At5g03795 isoform X2 [Ziziphus jujuba var. spinosa]